MKTKSIHCKLLVTILALFLCLSVTTSCGHEIVKLEYDELFFEVEACMRAITTFNNSFYGIIKNIGANRDIVNFDIGELQKKLQDPESLALLKEIAPLLGQNL